MSERIGGLGLYGDDIELNTDNTSLWTHKNEEHLDHIFVRLPERYNDAEDQARAVFIWRTIGKTAAAFALLAPEFENYPDAEKHLNIRQSTAADREEYARAALREAPQSWDGVPDNWA